jgi:hypothetical protein
MRTSIGIALILALSACGGSLNPPVNISNSAITISQGQGDPISAVPNALVIQPNGSATWTFETSPTQVRTTTLPSSLVSKLYKDLAAALPLGSLPPTSAEDAFAGSLFISVAGQTSPNILGETTGIAGTLYTDVVSIWDAFPPGS